MLFRSAEETWHGFPVVLLLALALLVTRIGADDSHDTAPADDLAVLADAADAGSDLHDFCSLLLGGKL